MLGGLCLPPASENLGRVVPQAGLSEVPKILKVYWTTRATFMERSGRVLPVALFED